MLTPSDKASIRATSADLIAGTGQAITRKRLKTAAAPTSFDPDYGEVLDRSEEDFDTLDLVGKVFWDPREDLLVRDFGGVIDARAAVHVPAAADVRAGDWLVIDGVWYAVGPVVPAPLGGYLAVAIGRTFARQQEPDA